MNRSFRFVLSMFLAATALLVMAPASSAQHARGDVAAAERAEQARRAQSGVSATARFTRVKYDPTWIRFRPNPYNGEHLTTSPDNNLSTFCFTTGYDGEYWELLYDHWQKVVGWTHSYNVTNLSSDACSSYGRETDLNLSSAWVHLAPHEDWAHEVVSQSKDIATTCFYQESPSLRWDVVLEHGSSTDPNANRVGFTYTSYLVSNKRAPVSCT